MNVVDPNIIHCYLDIPALELTIEDVTTEKITFNSDSILARSEPFIPLGIDGIEVNLCHYLRFAAKSEIQDHVLSMIPELKGSIRDIGFQQISNGKNKDLESVFFPHTDGLLKGTHNIAWHFNVGGPKVRTIWWQETNESLIRPPATYVKFSKGKSFKDLTQIDEVTWQLGRWGIFRTDILHSVHHIESARDALVISFSNQELYLEIIKKYS